MREDYFDFENIEEAREELDFNNLKQCPHCKNPIPKNSILCLYCGKSTSSSKIPKWKVIVILLVVFMFILWILFFYL